MLKHHIISSTSQTLTLPSAGNNLCLLKKLQLLLSVAPPHKFDKGVYKHWTGLLEWWNSGMVDWIFLFGFLIIYDVCSL